MKLSDTKIRSLKPKEKQYKVSDGDNLFLLITPKGAKYWRQRYFFAGKEKTLALDVYPDITLAKARQLKEQAKQELAHGNDPSFVKQTKKT